MINRVLKHDQTYLYSIVITKSSVSKFIYIIFMALFVIFGSKCAGFDQKSADTGVYSPAEKWEVEGQFLMFTTDVIVCFDCFYGGY